MRARDLGIPFEGNPGPLNAITDVDGLEVGFATLVEGTDVRTGVTAILPRGKASKDPVFAGWFPLNGNGEMTGTTWIEESGFLEGPVMLTNTHSVGAVQAATVKWQHETGKMFQPFSYPIVAETYDGDLNDINGFHVRAEHVNRALDTARPGAVAEGNVGAGTGAKCHEFKCGIGTSSRRVSTAGGEYTVGVLVQANYANGTHEKLRIAGVPVGQHFVTSAGGSKADPVTTDNGSIIIVVGTDAPLLPHQLKRIARRASLGLARMGSTADNGSGDLFVAFSTANAQALAGAPLAQAATIDNDHLDALFAATVDATEEAIVNALVAARDMDGNGGHRATALPHGELVRLLEQYGRLAGAR